MSIYLSFSHLTFLCLSWGQRLRSSTSWVKAMLATTTTAPNKMRSVGVEPTRIKSPGLTNVYSVDYTLVKSRAAAITPRAHIAGSTSKASLNASPRSFYLFLFKSPCYYVYTTNLGRKKCAAHKGIKVDIPLHTFTYYLDSLPELDSNPNIFLRHR